MNVAGGRFSDKTEKEDKLYSIRWPVAVTGGPVSAPQWTSEPAGLIFTNHTDPNAAPVVIGEYAYVRISGGSRGITYNVRHGVTVTGSGEYLEVTHNGEAGISMQITGYGGRRGEDYAWSHRSVGYG